MNGTLAERLVDAPRLAAPARSAPPSRRPDSRRRRPPASPTRSRTSGSRDLLLGLADHSPYLWTLVTEDPARLARLLAARRANRSTRLLAALAARRDDDEAALMRALRLAKREAALLIALADIGGVWDVVAATEALTRFRRRRGRRRARVSPAPERARRAARARSGGAGSSGRLRHGRARARQARRARAQLFERRRPHRALRRGGRLDPARGGARPALRAHRQGARAHPAGANQRRLRAASRPAPAARPRLDPGRAVDRQRLRLLRDARPELGARGADQGAGPRRAISSSASASSPSSRRSSGASISTTPPSPTFTR